MPRYLPPRPLPPLTEEDVARFRQALEASQIKTSEFSHQELEVMLRDLLAYARAVLGL